jgi:hypothetical protein
VAEEMNSIQSKKALYCPHGQANPQKQPSPRATEQ